MTGESVGPVEPVEPVHKVTSTDPTTGTEVTLTTSADLHPGMTVGEAILEVGGLIRPDETPPPAKQ